jgi:hypothetical protein
MITVSGNLETVGVSEDEISCHYGSRSGNWQGEPLNYSLQLAIRLRFWICNHVPGPSRV